jgi:hypothetical protein
MLEETLVVQFNIIGVVADGPRVLGAVTHAAEFSKYGAAIFTRAPGTCPNSDAIGSANERNRVGLET